MKIRFKILFLFFVFTLSKYYSAAQDTYFKKYLFNNTYVTLSFDIKENNQSLYLLNIYPNYSFSNVTNDIGILELNKLNGSILNEYKINQNPYTDYPDEFQFINKNLYMTGVNIIDTSYNLLFYKINLEDTNQNIYTQYSYPYYLSTIDQILSDSVLVVFNNKQLSSNPYNEGINIMVIDTFGNIIRSIDFGGNRLFLSSVFKDNTDFYIVGDYYPSSPIGSNHQLYIMKLNQNFDKLWAKEIEVINDPNNSCVVFGNDIIKINDTLIVTGYFWSGFSECLNNHPDFGVLAALDTAGNAFWQKQIYYPWKARTKIIDTKDNHFVVIGNLLNFNDSLQIYDRMVGIVKYNLNGDTIWTKTYQEYGFENWITSAERASDGGFYICGYSTSQFSPNNYQSFVYKLDNCGCLIPNCNPNCISQSVGINSKHNLQVNIYPNPSQEYLYLDFGYPVENFHYEIYDLVDRKLLQGSSTLNMIDIRTLQNDFYILKVSLNGKHSILKFIKSN